jgi:uncharacterized protein
VRLYPEATMPLVRRGYALLANGDTKAAYADFVAAANRSDYWALDKVVGTLCYGNDGIARDADRLRPWVEHGASIGHGMSEQLLGTMYLQGLDGVAVNREKAIEYYRRSARHGYANGQHDLATVLLQTATSDAEKQQAVAWLQEAARQEHRFAREKLARMGIAYAQQEGDVN